MAAGQIRYRCCIHQSHDLSDVYTSLSWATSGLSNRIKTTESECRRGKTGEMWLTLMIFKHFPVLPFQALPTIAWKTQTAYRRRFLNSCQCGRYFYDSSKNGCWKAHRGLFVLITEEARLESHHVQHVAVQRRHSRPDSSLEIKPGNMFDTNRPNSWSLY